MCFYFKGERNMKPVLFENPRNREKVVCNDVKRIQIIDGVEYFLVHHVNEPREFLMRKDAVRQISKL
jgi:hypothetical protein